MSVTANYQNLESQILGLSGGFEERGYHYYNADVA